MGYLEERWNQWHRLRQKKDQTIQDYTTEFRRQALTLGVSLNDPSTCTKYLSGLHERIRAELSLFPIQDLSSASTTAMAIERKNKAYGEKKSQIGNFKQTKKFSPKKSKKG